MHDVSALSPLPRQLTLYVNYACHLRCKHCYLYGVADYDHPYMAPMTNSAMPWDTFRKAVDPMLESGAALSLFLMGGEPCLHERLADMVAYVARHPSTYVDMNTHGMLLPKKAAGLIAAGINGIYVSLDGSQASTNDPLRGVGSFDRAIKGILAAIAARGAARTPKVAINATITNGNVHDLVGMADKAVALGVDEIFFNLPVFVTEKEGLASERAMAARHGIAFSSWRGFRIDPVIDGIDTQVLVSQLEQLKARKWPLPLFLQPIGYSPRELATYFTDDWARTLRQRACPVRDFRATVLPNGDVTPCTIYPDVVLGNLVGQTLPEVWTGAAYRRFRQDVGQRLLPTCRRCCDLFDETQGDPDAFLNDSRSSAMLSGF
ncbi:MAG TPA: radical SAM protein [Propylenella sp.]|nr:radical SAM protein [Propylenella sp.]